MRIFKDFREAKGEIERDLKEMGVLVKGTHMQDKVGEFHTLELSNYGYTVLHPDIKDLHIPNPNWFTAEWKDRLNGIEGKTDNPGNAFRMREDKHIVWQHMLEYGGQPIPEGKTIQDIDKENLVSKMDPLRFSYTYQERFATDDQVWRIIRELRRNPQSRQLYIAMWNPMIDAHRIGIRRVPCSIGWHFMMRDGLNITYTMRSCDFVTHWANDVGLSMRLLEYVSQRAGVKRGTFSQFINSLHVYKKDVEDIY